MPQANVSNVSNSSMETLGSYLAKFGALAFILNEIRGAILALPVIYTMWHAGSDAMKLWLCFCTIAGIGLSVVVPMWAMRSWSRRRHSLT